ncbi:MAG: ABC transporter substrate-binding protein, partial [Acidobacteriota bacterium]|nr:ABC transporter substrate-binding protein [Acidobacteriota bacterium]
VSCAKKQNEQGEAQRQKVHLEVGHLSATGHTKYFIAKEAGFFDEEGLDVNLVEFANSADGISAIRSGNLDIGSFSTTAPLLHIAKGADLHILGGVMGEDAAIVVAKDSPIASVADLKGKKIATVRLATGDAVLRGALTRAGIDFKKDVAISELKSPPAVLEAVKAGEVDAGVTWGPHDQRTDEYGLKIIARSKTLWPGHPCCRLVSLGETLEKQEKVAPDVWVRFLRAFLKAEKFARDNHEKTIEYLAKYVPLNPDLLDRAYYGGFLDQSTDPNVDGVVEFYKIMRESGQIEDEPTVPEDIHPFINTQYYAQALESLATEQPAEPFWQELQKVFEERN